jgi:glucuronosyltransferase
MGITYVPSDLPPKNEMELINAFSRLKQRVIMKLNNVPDNLPKNIMVKPFLPQQSILAHPKTRMFFTHAGNNGLLESINNRVPMVGLPIYLNQEDNLNILIERGVAEGVNKHSEADEIYETCMKVLTDVR